MKLFAYICVDGHTLESPDYSIEPLCHICGKPSRRDYRAESVNIDKSSLA